MILGCRPGVGGKMVPWCNLRLRFVSFVLAAVVSGGFSSPTQPCLEVEVTGGVYQQDFNGYYRLDRDYWHKCSQRPAWISNFTSTDGLHTYIYYLQEGFDGWVIARSSCLEWGDFLAVVRADVLTPFNVKSENGWKEYSDVNKSMVFNDRLTVTCVSVGEDFCGSFPCAQGESCISLIDGFKCYCTDNAMCSSDGRHPTTHNADIGNSTKQFVLSATAKFSLKVAVLSTLIVVSLALIVCLILYQLRQNKRNTEQVEDRKPRRIYSGNDQISYTRLKETNHHSTENVADSKSAEFRI